jgi:hypothetical protein
MRLFCLFFLAVSLWTSAGCALVPTEPRGAEKITEVSLRGSTGLLGSSFEVTLHRGGTARLECSFDNLDKDDQPPLEYAEPFCQEMYRRSASSFVKTGTQTYDKRLEGVFAAAFPPASFDETARLVIKNGFLSMRDRYADGARTDSPADRTAVVYDGELKEVFDAGDAGSEELAEIKRSIYAIAKQTGWTSEKK